MGSIADDYSGNSGIPLLGHHSNQSVIRTGSTWTAVAHIITAVIGSGVLSLAWSMAQLGWIWGLICILFFSSVTLLSCFLLSNCYTCDHAHPAPAPRNASYMAAVNHNLGIKYARICGVIINMYLYGSGVGCTIITAICLRTLRQSVCYQNHGRDCEFGNTPYIVLFGVVQMFMSLIPDLHSMTWLSTLAAAMSFVYSTIALGLSAAKTLSKGNLLSSIKGVPTAATGIENVWRASQAVGDIAFAYTCTFMFFEIQDTLKSPPSESRTMKKASIISICITTFFYLGCGGFGYAAFGDQTPGDILTGFSAYAPYWLINLANACVVIHLIGAYQVGIQPLFSMADEWLGARYRFHETNYTLKLPYLGAWRINLNRMYFRTAYVASTTAVAIVFPYFNQVLGVLGAMYFWPFSIYFPIEMHLKRRKITRWKPEWIIFQGISVASLLITLFIFIGSIQGIVSVMIS